MPTLQELNNKVDELQSALDTEQQEVRDVIAALEQTVADLQAAQSDGGTPEEREAILVKLQSAIDDLKETIPSAPPPEG